MCGVWGVDLMVSTCVLGSRALGGKQFSLCGCAHFMWRTYTSYGLLRDRLVTVKGGENSVRTMLFFSLLGETRVQEFVSELSCFVFTRFTFSTCVGNGALFALSGE